MSLAAIIWLIHLVSLLTNSPQRKAACLVISGDFEGKGYPVEIKEKQQGWENTCK